MSDHKAKRFELQQNWDDSWSFRFVADNGEEVGEPSYSSKQAAITGINAMRECWDAPVRELPKQKAPEIEENSPSEAMP